VFSFLLIPLFLTQAMLSNRLAAWVHPEEAEASQTLRMDKKVASVLRAIGFLSGYRVLVGHVFWIKVLQYYGDSDNAGDRYSKLYDYCSLASDLNPKFTAPYTFGGATLAFQLKRQDEAIRLLQKGINSNPGEIRLKLMLAALVYQNLQEYDKVIPFLEAQVMRGDAPYMLINILANTYSKVGRYEDAIRLFKKIIRETDSPETRIQAAQKLQEIYNITRSGQSAQNGKAGSKSHGKK
jgi:pentatricopeptide repeat protein